MEEPEKSICQYNNTIELYRGTSIFGLDQRVKQQKRKEKEKET